MVTTTNSSVDIVNLEPAVELTPEREAWLVDGLVEALPSLRLRALFEQRRDMFTEADLITVAVAKPSATVIGALCSRWSTTDHGARFLYVTTQFVGDAHQHGVVFRQSWMAHLEAVYAGPWGFPAVTALKTYNPKVFCAMRALSHASHAGFYPSLDPSLDNASDIVELAESVAGAVAPGHRFDRRTGVIAGVGVPPDLYPELPLSNDHAVNEYFARTTKPGDRVLCLLTVPTAQGVQDVLRRFVPGSGIPPVVHGTGRPHRFGRVPADRTLGLPTPGGIPGREC